MPTKFRDGFRTSEDYASFHSELGVQQATSEHGKLGGQSNLVRLVSWRDREGRPGERTDDDRLAREAWAAERGSGSVPVMT